MHNLTLPAYVVQKYLSFKIIRWHSPGWAIREGACRYVQNKIWLNKESVEVEPAGGFSSQKLFVETAFSEGQVRKVDREIQG